METNPIIQFWQFPLAVGLIKVQSFQGYYSNKNIQARQMYVCISYMHTYRKILSNKYLLSNENIIALSFGQNII